MKPQHYPITMAAGGLKRWSSPEMDITLRYAAPCEDGWWRLLTGRLRFLTPQLGWVLGGGQVLLTEDSGHSWKNRYKGIFSSESLGPENIDGWNSGVWCLLTRRGPNHLRFYLTHDLGRTWEKKQSSIDRGMFCDLFALKSSSHAWVVNGGAAGKPCRLYVTTDQGNYWDRFHIQLSGGAPLRIYFTNERNGWILETHHMRAFAGRRYKNRSASTIHITNDGGLTWRPQAELAAQATFLHVLDSNTLFVGGNNGSLLRSVDGGNTWRKIRLGTRFSLADMHLRGHFGVVLGTSDIIESTRDVFLAKTRDGGQTWQRIKMPMHNPFHAAYLTSWDTGVLASTYGIFTFKLL